MQKEKNKLRLRHFLEGIICGLIIGGGTVFLVYKYNIPVIERIKYITIHDLSINNLTKSFRSSKKDTLSSHVKTQDSKLTTQNAKDSANIYNDSIKTHQINPETRKNIPETLNPIIDNDNRNINVVKDELIYTLEIPIDNKEQQKKNEEESKLSNELTDNPQPVQKQNLLIEFWKSPLNYQGYRMSANRLVIYGLSDVETPEFLFYNNSLYLLYYNEKHDSYDYYHLDNTEQFKPLVKITNINLINQLKQSSKK